MHDSESAEIAEIKATGLKATLPRLKILHVFHTRAQRHWSAEQLYMALSEEGAVMGLATVYRVLTEFERAGLLHRTHFDAGKSLFELAREGHHDHLVCLRCGRIEEFFDEEIERRQLNVASARGFEVKDHALVLYGYCASPNCRR